jgi:hypothetical protein
MEPQIFYSGERFRPWEHEAPARELLGIVGDALAFSPPLYFSSIFGLPRELVPPYRRFAELRMLDLWRLRRAMRYLSNLTIPSLPMAPPAFGPPLLNDLLWDPSEVLHCPDHNGSYTTFQNETWLYINGVATNDAVARLNVACLADLFHRPITVIQNSTDGLLIDLVQCAVGKQWRKATEPAIKAFPVLYDALTDPDRKRVVLIAHSQGTIVAANLLRMLYKITEPAEPADPVSYEGVGAADDGVRLDLADFDPLERHHLAKLELYCFATCANELKYFPRLPTGSAPIPWIEHFGNEFDLVARLGMLAPDPERWQIDIDGPRYVHTGRWGHLLNMHYLFDIADEQRRGHRRGGQKTREPYRLVGRQDGIAGARPRLYAYINGGRSALEAGKRAELALAS